MKLLLAIALMLMLSSLAFAAPETQQLGPYTVSFDMNTNMQYQIKVLDPVDNPSATTYSLVIETSNETGAGITITAFKNYTDSTSYILKNIAGMRMALYGFNATVNDKAIDGKDGYLVTGVRNAEGSEMKAFEASYWLDSMNCECGQVPAGTVSVGKTNVGIRSSYPEDVTENLLNSLHVEMGQAPAQAEQQMPTQQMPPQQMSTKY